MIQKFNANNLFTFALLGQFFMWFYLNKVSPNYIIVPDPPQMGELELLSFGDKAFYFRTNALVLQSAGDSFGRFEPLKCYDYNKLSQWFYLLDELDHKSNFFPSLASYYYSQTQRPSELIHIINYLDKHVQKSPSTKWWWLAQAVYIANYRYNDHDLALNLAYKLSKIEANMPIWAKQMPAFIHEKKGEYEQALVIIKDIIDNHQNLSPQELNFMNYFITERLDKIKNM